MSSMTATGDRTARYWRPLQKGHDVINKNNSNFPLNPNSCSEFRGLPQQRSILPLNVVELET